MHDEEGFSGGKTSKAAAGPSFGPTAAEEAGFHVVDRRVSQMQEEEIDELDAQEPSGAPTYVQQLEQQLARAHQRLEELQTQLREELATEVEQTRRRLEREAEQQALRQRAAMAAPMMEVLEALERSLQLGGNASSEAVLSGVELVHQLMLRKLLELGLERMTTVGEPFDPAKHEAIGLVAVSDPSQNNCIVAELSPGFLLDGRVVRAPRVQVGRS